MVRLSVALTVLVLGACANRSVTPFGPNTWMVVGMAPTPPQATADAARRASVFCSEKGLVMLPTNARPVSVYAGANTEFVFQCITQAEAANMDFRWQSAPDVVVKQGDVKKD